MSIFLYLLIYNIETGEWRQVADDYQRLELRALRLFDKIPAEARDFYRQLILFPVQAMANLYDMYYAQAMNQYLAANKNPDANVWAERVRETFRRDSLLCASYNQDIAGGKWNGIRHCRAFERLCNTCFETHFFRPAPVGILCQFGH